MSFLFIVFYGQIFVRFQVGVVISKNIQFYEQNPLQFIKY